MRTLRLALPAFALVGLPLCGQAFDVSSDRNLTGNPSALVGVGAVRIESASSLVLVPDVSGSSTMMLRTGHLLQYAHWRMATGK